MECEDHTLEAGNTLNSHDAVGEKLLADTGITSSSEDVRAALLAQAGSPFLHADSVVGDDGMLLFPPLYMDAADESFSGQIESGEINAWSDPRGCESGFSSNDDASKHVLEVQALRNLVAELGRRFLARADFAYLRDRMRALEARGLSLSEIARTYHHLSVLLSATENSLLTAQQRARLALQALEDVVTYRH